MNRYNKHQAHQTYEKDDQSEAFAVTRKSRLKTVDRINYNDPFKDHMKRMEDKLKYGGEGESPITKGAYGGFADSKSMGGNKSQAGLISN